MPEQFDPNWEYYTADPEIEELIQQSNDIRMDNADRLPNTFEDRRTHYLTGYRVFPIDMLKWDGTYFGRYRINKRHTNPLEQRVCQNEKCRKLFYPRVRESVVQRYCSIKCSPHRGSKKVLPLERVCALSSCGKIFAPLYSTHECCSMLCCNRLKMVRYKEQLKQKMTEQRITIESQLGISLPVCPMCNGAIIQNTGAGARKIYCSRQCTIRAKNKRYYEKHMRK